MRSAGLVVVFVALSILCVVGMVAVDNLANEARADNNTSSSDVDSVAGITGTLLNVFGYLILLVGAYCVIQAYASM